MMKPLRTVETITMLALCHLLVACSNSHDSDNNNVIAAPLLERYTLSSPDSVPEGVAFDPVERAFYAGSLQGGGIARIDADGSESVFRAADNRARLVGIKVDADRRTLWACATEVDGLDSRAWVFDLTTGALVSEYLLGAISTGGTCNDLALDADGNAYISDPVNPNIYRVNPTNDEAVVFASDPLLADSLDIDLGNNGIAVSPDGESLVVAKFIPAQLVRISLSDPREVSAISLSGDDFPSPDGLAFVGNLLYSISDNSISQITLGSDGITGSVINRGQISGLSTATVADAQLYAIKSEVVNFVLQQPLNLPFEIFRVDLADFQ